MVNQVPPTLKFLRKELREVSPSSDVMMGWGLLKLFESLLQVLAFLGSIIW